MEARDNPDSISEGLRDRHLPVEIPRADWRRLHLDIEVRPTIRLDQTNNWEVLIQTVEDGTRYRTLYRDPQLTIRANSVEWLQTARSPF